MEVGTHPSYKERNIKDGVKVKKKKQTKKTKSKVILSVLSILGKQVHDNSGSCPYCRPKRHNSLCPTLGASPTARCLPTTTTRNQKTISP